MKYQKFTVVMINVSWLDVACEVLRTPVVEHYVSKQLMKFETCDDERLAACLATIASVAVSCKMCRHRASFSLHMTNSRLPVPLLHFTPRGFTHREGDPCIESRIF